MSERRSEANMSSTAFESIGARLRSPESQLARLLESRVIRSDDRCRGALPEVHGIYRIFDPAKPEETIRAGRTRTAAGGRRSSSRTCSSGTRRRSSRSTRP
jgi:hypothetical protein